MDGLRPVGGCVGHRYVVGDGHGGVQEEGDNNTAAACDYLKNRDFFLEKTIFFNGL